LSTLISQNAGSPLAAKAKNLLIVLSRRSQIEEELRNLKIERPKEDSLFIEPMPVAPQVEKKQEISAKPKDTLMVKQQVKAKPVVDSIAKKVINQPAASSFVYDANATYYTMVVLNKIDVVFANETRNAFQRYNRGTFPNAMDVKVVPLNDDIKLVLIGNFSSAADAIAYVQKVKPVAPSQILPWLKADKFSFSIITEQNLQAVLKAKELSAYQKFLEQALPVKL
jgi:hypothetical protein